MTDEESDEDKRRREFEERLAKEWGPQISARRRIFSGVVIVVTFVGLVVGALMIAP